MFTRFLACAVLLATTIPLAAQSLADVARAEEARRKAIKGQAKVYTNDTLRGVDGGPAPAPPPASSATTSPVAATTSKPASGGASQPEASAASKPVAPAAADTAKGDKYWRDRAAAARDALSRSQTFAHALQSQINALSTEFVNMDDPLRRSVIEQKRSAAIAEQDRVKADIVKQANAIAEIEDEARRANVPPGWLR